MCLYLCLLQLITYYERFLIRTQDKAKWHDPTVQLDLASYKLQLAYNQVFSTFKNIEDCINQDIGIDNETANILMQKLDKTFKEINTAKTLAEFVVLLMARSGFNDLRGGQPVVDDTAINQNPNLPIIIDSDPQILDEVFEEYIKEEYLKLNEDTDECSLEQRKLDKLLAKNFISELKEALIDKHKSMSERESKALQRIYKNVSRDSVSSTTWTEDNKDCQVVPIPPPMPSYYIWSSSDTNSDREKVIPPVYKIRIDPFIQREFNESNEENDLVRALKRKNICNISSTEVCENRDEEFVVSLPQILLETQARRFITKPPSFLHEEMFIGSGENSEDEIVDNASDDEEDNKNSEQ